jgi:hypothetical protein
MSGWGKADNKTASGTIELAVDGSVTGTSTAFTTQAAVGDILTANSIDFRITAITDNTNATVVDADTPGAAIVAQAAGASYTLSEKPTMMSFNSVGGYASETVYGVDENEMAANNDVEGAAHAGWVHVRTNGSRKIVETLVAMSKNGITGDAEDVVFEDFRISITTQPADDSSATGEAVTFAVVAAITGTGGTLTYQWQLDSGSGFANITDGGVYSDATTDTLAISDNTGLDTNEYRCVVSATGADSVTSDAATLTETA